MDEIKNPKNEIKKPKKRGRKPKEKKEVKKRTPKKRGRKPKGKVLPYIKDLEVPTVDTICSNIVTNLPININDLNSDNDDKEYDDIFMEEESNINTHLFDYSDTPEEDITCNCKKYELKINELNKQILDLKNELNEIKMIRQRKIHKINTNFYTLDGDKQKYIKQTDIHCWWCCHQFVTPPCQLPDKYYNNQYYVFGCFCSYNCAQAYNLDLDDYKTSIRTTLLNSLYNKIYNNEKEIVTALPRQTLSIFGGPLSITKYRENFLDNDKEFRFILPPMTSLISIVEEDYKNKNNRITDNLKLKRSKPLPNSKYSLEYTMGLKKKSN
jgi:hypothetical protein